jgi:hypothetical protein
MIVLGADTHKRSHTIAAVARDRASCRRADGRRSAPRLRGALVWARGLGDERVWALEDCRHVSGSFGAVSDRRGERVVRVATRLMAGERASRGARQVRSASTRSPSRARRCAKASTRCRSPSCGRELDMRLLVDHRERLVRSASRSTTTCNGICTTCGPS